MSLLNLMAFLSKLSVGCYRDTIVSSQTFQMRTRSYPRHKLGFETVAVKKLEVLPSSSNGRVKGILFYVFYPLWYRESPSTCVEWKLFHLSELNLRFRVILDNCGMCHLMKFYSLLHAFTLQAIKAGVGGIGMRVHNVNIARYWTVNN